MVIVILVIAMCRGWRNGPVLRKASDFEVKGQGKKWRLNSTWKKKVEEEIVKVGLNRGRYDQSGLLALI